MNLIRHLPALVFLLLAPALHAASFVVINTDDTGAGSLRQALADAAAVAGADEVTFAPGLSGQSIALSGPEVGGSTALAVGDTDGVTVDALSLPGGLTLHDGEGTGYRAFLVYEGGILTLRGLTFTGFRLPRGGGGGVMANNGTLTLMRCSLSDNSATADGGAIYSSRGSLTATQCSFTSNSTGGCGGAIAAYFGILTLTQCTISGNSSATVGGAIEFNSQTVLPEGTLTQCSLTGNTAGIYGGAIWNKGLLSLTDCSLTGNGTRTGNGAGGAISTTEGELVLKRCFLAGNSAAFLGGAIYGFSCGLSLSQCTLYGNTSSNGGAISNGTLFGSLTLTHCTISGNSAGTAGGVYYKTPLTIENSIISGNSGFTGPDIMGAQTVSAGGVSLIGNLSQSGLTVGPNIITGAPILAPPGNYGGFSQTMALRPGSPARDAAGVLAPALTGDQRGFPMVGAPDIGAYEAGTITNFENFIWETLPATATPGQHAAGADYDGDAASNEHEWYAGTDVSDPASSFRVAQVARSDNQLLLSWPSVSTRKYRLWQSDGLSGWTPAPGQSVLPGTGSALNFMVPIAGERQHFRVEAIVP